jgi:UDP-2,3-diacylglucosamine pyrophosphatase LpxH
MMKGNIVIVSCIHLDFWKEKSDYWKFKEEKKRLWPKFIKHIKPTTKQFIINGDLLDIPSQSGKSIDPYYSKLLEPLRELWENGTKITYVLGNHDIGLAGLRVDEPEGLRGRIFPRLEVKYPWVMVKAGGKNYYIEHGDYELFGIDTVLALIKYARNILLQRGPRDLTRWSARVKQRRDPFEENVPIRQPPGVINKPPSFFEYLFKKYPREINAARKLHWRYEAEKKLKKLQKRGGNPSGIIFGHTHLPDEEAISTESYPIYKITSGQVTDLSKDVIYTISGARYYNVGSWTADIPCASYLVIKPDGSVKRKCFKKDKRDKDLTMKECNLEVCYPELFKKVPKYEFKDVINKYKKPPQELS